MSALPLLPPVPLDGDVDHGQDLNGTIWFLTGLTTIIFVARLYARQFITRNIGWEDLALGVSMVRTPFPLPILLILTLIGSLICAVRIRLHICILRTCATSILYRARKPGKYFQRR